MNTAAVAEVSKEGSLRELMPFTAEVVDWLRVQIGKEAADRIVLKGRQGKGCFKAVETGPDGVSREFGSFHRNTRWPGTAGDQHGA